MTPQELFQAGRLVEAIDAGYGNLYCPAIYMLLDR